VRKTRRENSKIRRKEEEHKREGGMRIKVENQLKLNYKEK